MYGKIRRRSYTKYQFDIKMFNLVLKRNSYIETLFRYL